MDENPFEIPQAIRALAGQDLTQDHAAHEQLDDFDQ